MKWYIAVVAAGVLLGIAASRLVPVVLADDDGPNIHIVKWDNIACLMGNPVIRLYPAEKRTEVKCE
jgi:hypothetical protein